MTSSRQELDKTIILRVPELEEYCWVRPKGISGMFLFERDGIFLGGQRLGGSDTVGMPPGAYRIVVISGTGRILEASFTAPSGGERRLLAKYFR